MSREEKIKAEMTVAQLLGNNHIWCEEVTPHSETSFCIQIRGDWKHDHLRTKWLMEENGYQYIAQYTEPSEEDSYTARYYYRYKEA